MSIDTAAALIFFLPLWNGPASENCSEHSGWRWLMWLDKFDVGHLLLDLTIFLQTWHLNCNEKSFRCPGMASKSSKNSAKWANFRLNLGSGSSSAIIYCNKTFILNNFRVCAKQKCLEKCFKILNIFGIRKPKQIFSFFILSYFGFVTADALVYVNIEQGIHCNTSKVAQNEKLFGFSYSKNMANIEAFLKTFLSSTNSKIVRGALVTVH